MSLVYKNKSEGNNKKRGRGIRKDDQQKIRGWPRGRLSAAATRCRRCRRTCPLLTSPPIATPGQCPQNCAPNREAASRQLCGAALRCGLRSGSPCGSNGKRCGLAPVGQCAYQCLHFLYARNLHAVLRHRPLVPLFTAHEHGFVCGQPENLVGGGGGRSRRAN